VVLIIDKLIGGLGGTNIHSKVSETGKPIILDSLFAFTLTV
jgi:hypothetical protein